VDARGSGIAGARMTALTIEGQPHAQSDAEGRIQLKLAWPLRSIHDGTEGIRLLFSGQGFANRRHDLAECQPGSVDLGTITLDGGATIRGRVVDTSGQPVTGSRTFTAPAPLGSLDEADEDALAFGGLRPLPADLSGRTDSHGEYVLEGVPVGTIVVCANAPGMLYSHTEPLSVSVGQSILAEDIVLREAGAEQRIEGIVLDPQGAVLSGIRLQLMDSDGTAFLTDARTGVDGSFSFVVSPRRPYAVQATDDRDRWESVLATELEAGDLDVELQFATAVWVRFLARDEQGREVPGTTLRLWDTDQRGIGAATKADETGGLLFRVPAKSFYADVLAPGFVRSRRGPFELRDVPDPLVFLLEEALPVTGTVQSTEGPLAGVEVHLHRELAGAECRRSKDGFYTRVDPRELAAATTDEQGKFALPFDTHGTYRLHAAAPGFAPAETSVTIGGPAASVDVLLSQGGEVWGKVENLGEGAGLVGISSGDSHVYVAAIDDGTYELKNVAPGSHQILLSTCGADCSFEPCDQPVDAWGVNVPEGTRVRFDLAAGDCTLRGRLALSGRGHPGWSWTLMGNRKLFQGTTGSKGRFEAQVESPGRYALTLSSPFRNGHITSYKTDVLLVPGDNEWEFDVPVGSLVLSNLDLPDRVDFGDPNPSAGVGLVASGAGFTWEARIAAAKDGEVEIHGVPAGRIEIRLPGSSAAGARVEEWPVLSELNVLGDRENSYALP
jgi:hypothetical protein